jgi:hypothetical protein
MENHIQDHKSIWVDAQTKLWDDCLEDLKDSFERYPQLTSFIVNNYDAFESITRVYFISGVNSKTMQEAFDLHRYMLPYDMPGVMHFIASFISHEINDDGSPAVVWYAIERATDFNLRLVVPSTTTDPKSYCILVRDIPDGMFLDSPESTKYLESAWDDTIPTHLELAINNRLESERRINEMLKREPHPSYQQTALINILNQIKEDVRVSS